MDRFQQEASVDEMLRIGDGKGKTKGEGEGGESTDVLKAMQECCPIILSNILASVDQGIRMVSETFKFSVIEPYTLSRLLEYKARALELELRGVKAIDVMVQAETVSLRCLGASAGNTIRLTVEGLRLHVKFGSSKDPTYAAYAAGKASEINAAIIGLSFQDILLADRFTKRCAELLALAVLVQEDSLLPSQRYKKKMEQDEYERGKAKYKGALRGGSKKGGRK